MASSIDAVSANLVLIIGVMKSSILAESIITIVGVALNTSSTIAVSFGIKSTGAITIRSSTVADSSRTVMLIVVISSSTEAISLTYFVSVHVIVSSTTAVSFGIKSTGAI